MRLKLFLCEDSERKPVSVWMGEGEFHGKLTELGTLVHEGRLLRWLGTKSRPNTCTAGNWPMTSLGAGCHPKQRKKFEKDSIAKGVPTRFNERGDAVFESRSHRKQYLAAYGMHDRDGCYGD